MFETKMSTFEVIFFKNFTVSLPYIATLKEIGHEH